MSDPKRQEEKRQQQLEKSIRYETAVKDYVKHGIEFIPFPKIPRLNRPITITEKIDGTNGAIHISNRHVVAVIADDQVGTGARPGYEEISPMMVAAQSRTRLLTAEEDNFGFAKWVEANAQALREVLGPGVHFGEWWGQGIQRGYNQTRKWFSLFNYNRWTNDPSVAALATIGLQVVPILYRGPWMAVVGGPDLTEVYPQRDSEGKMTAGALRFAPDVILANLQKRGSVAASVNGVTYKKNNTTGDKGAEGIVVFHEAGHLLFKATIEGDEAPKTAADAAHERLMREIEKEGFAE